MKKTIHTEFYGNKVETMLLNLFKCFENSMRYQIGRTQRRTAAHFNIIRDTSNEIIVQSIDDYCYGIDAFTNRNEVEARGWLAWQLKICAHEYLKHVHNDNKHVGWKRNNNTIIDWLSTDDCNITIGDVYCVYDLLNNRTRTDVRYSAEQIAELRGKANDPFMTEQENVRRAEIKRINDELHQKLRANDNLSYEEQRQAEKVIREKYNKLNDELKAAAKAEIATLNKQFDEILAAQQMLESQVAA